MKEYFKEIVRGYSFRITVSAIVMTIIILSLKYLGTWGIIQGIIPRKLVYVWAASCAIIVIAWIIHSKVVDLFKIKIVSSADSLVMSMIIALTICTMVFAIEKASKTAISVLVIILGALTLTLIIRVVCYATDNSKDITRESTLVELKDLYFGNLPDGKGQLLQINEAAVDYDMFNREIIARRIIASIPSGSINQAYTIGIEGKWGSGKTTVITQAKAILKTTDRKDIVIVDDFEPWAIGNQHALLNKFYDLLLEKAGIRYKGSLARDINYLVEQFLSERPYVGSVIKTIKNHRTTDDKADEIGNKISSFLLKTGKVFVVTIDDIDRMDADNIRTLIRAIGTILNMPNLVFIIAYEKERLDSAFEDNTNIEPRYNEKIIQQIITLPELKRSDIELIHEQCLNNLFDYYEVEEYRRKEIREVRITKMPFVKDIRQLKRYLNSVVVPVIYENNNLNSCDLLAINTIQFFNQELYESIRENRKYYISINMNNDGEVGLEGYLNITFNIQKYNDEGKEYFSKIEKQHPEYTKMLLLLFPSFKKYKDSRLLKEEGYYKDPEALEKENKKSICSGSYFDLYYTYGTNGYIEVETYIQNMLTELNLVEDGKTYLDNKIRESVLAMNGNGQRLWLEHLQNHVKESLPQKSGLIAEALLDSVLSFDEMLSFGEISARQRAEYIVELLIKTLDRESLKDVLAKYSSNYELLLTVARIRNSMRGEGASIKDDTDYIIEELDTLYNDLCKGVTRGAIDLYSDEFYSHNNIWGLDKEAAGIEIGEYVSKVYKDEYVYRILGDATGMSIGGGYNYWIYHNNYCKLGLKESVIDNSNIAVPPKNEAERAIKRVYELYKSTNNKEKVGKEFGDDEHSYKTYEPIDYSLL